MRVLRSFDPAHVIWVDAIPVVLLAFGIESVVAVASPDRPVLSPGLPTRADVRVGTTNPGGL
ncbi:MAG: hypothetical protein ACRD0J_02445, partial [Acidimicrobiales bacterium]